MVELFRRIAVGQQLAHAVEALVEAPDAAEDLITGNRKTREPAEDGSREAGEATLRIEDAEAIGATLAKQYPAANVGVYRLLCEIRPA